jgi:low affinity Fe/Cu permease
MVSARVAHEGENLKETFRIGANKIADNVGSPGAFCIGLLAVLVWAVTGPLYHFSDTWQLVINTGTSVVTFLMVFLIQNTQNRDAQAMQLKLNELIRAVSTARNMMVDLENCTEDEIREIREEFQNIRAKISAKKELNQN